MCQHEVCILWKRYWIWRFSKGVVVIGVKPNYNLKLANDVKTKRGPGTLWIRPFSLLKLHLGLMSIISKFAAKCSYSIKWNISYMGCCFLTNIYSNNVWKSLAHVASCEVQWPQRRFTWVSCYKQLNIAIITLPIESFRCHS